MAIYLKDDSEWLNEENQILSHIAQNLKDEPSCQQALFLRNYTDGIAGLDSQYNF